MIDPILFTGWVITIWLIIITPGPDTLLIMRNSANSGRAVGFASVAGVQAGVLFHTALAAFGISAILADQPPVILAIGIGGGLFIAFLAWQTWSAGVLGGTLQTAKRTTKRRAFLDALVTNALNPKVILAFFAIMASFTAADLPTVPQVLLMALASLILNTLWQSALVLFSDWFFSVLTHPGAQRWINRVVALVLLIFAVLLPYQAIQKAGKDSSHPSSDIIEGSALN